MEQGGEAQTVVRLLELNTRARGVDTLIKVANWNRFKEEVKIENFQINSTEDLERAAEELEQQINEAITENNKTKIIHQNYSLPAYLKQLLKKKNKTKKKYCRTLHP